MTGVLFLPSRDYVSALSISETEPPSTFAPHLHILAAMASTSSNPPVGDTKPTIPAGDVEMREALSNAPPAARQPSAKRQLEPHVRRAKAEELYKKCVEYPRDTLFFQSDLASMDIADDMGELSQLLTELVDRHLFKLMTLDNDPCWRYRTTADAQVSVAPGKDRRQH
jgi:hypothetical protein